jgi:hypothetical protein
MTIKLSKSQQHVVDRLNSGWSLGHMGGTVWIQEGGLGCGGISENVHTGTFYSLVLKGVIVPANRYLPTTEYVLTEEYRNDN